MQVETQDQVIKTVNVAGYKSLLQLSKADGNGSLMISLNQQTMVVIEAEPVTGEKEIVALAEEVQLEKNSHARQVRPNQDAPLFFCYSSLPRNSLPWSVLLKW